MLHKKHATVSDMIESAILIIQSVHFLEGLINAKLGELEEAVINGYSPDAARLEKEIKALIKKIGNENRNMDSFMEKYKEEEIYEKKTTLSHP